MLTASCIVAAVGWYCMSYWGWGGRIPYTQNREYGCGDPPRWPRGTLYPQKLTLTRLTSGGRSVGIVMPQTKATELLFIITSGYFAAVAQQWASVTLHYTYIWTQKQEQKWKWIIRTQKNSWMENLTLLIWNLIQKRPVIITNRNCTGLQEQM
jgi:hypothetical protein